MATTPGAHMFALITTFMIYLEPLRHLRNSSTQSIAALAMVAGVSLAQGILTFRQLYGMPYSRMMSPTGTPAGTPQLSIVLASFRHACLDGPALILDRPVSHLGF